MTLSAIYDRLMSQTARRLDFTDGSYVLCPAALAVDFADGETLAQAWIEVCEDGLVLHFNANRRSSHGQSGLTGQEEPFGNIASVS
jgi:hypothetical protein